jgi:hypothetical protein
MNPPELPPAAVTGTLDGVLSDVEERAARFAAFILDLEAEAEAIGRVETRLTERRRGLEKRCKWLRSHLLAHLRTCGLDRVTAPDKSTKFSVREDPPSGVMELDIESPESQASASP